MSELITRRTFLKRLRKDSLTPVIVLSARSDEKGCYRRIDKVFRRLLH